MQAALQICGQIGGVVGILLSALSARISGRETILPGIISDVGLAGVLIAIVSIALVASIASIAAQAEQVMENLRNALASVGATYDNLVKTTVFVTDVGNRQTLNDVRAKYLNQEALAASTLVVVAGLASPDYLLEIEAIAKSHLPLSNEAE